MQFNQNHKIDLNEEYPCPRCKGKLFPIILTEAMGCDRCQQIFVVTETGKEIEQLSSVYPHQKRWSWTGKRWKVKAIYNLEHYLSFGILMVLTMLIVSIPVIIKFSEGLTLFFGIIICLVLILLSLSLWLSSRR